MPKTKLIIFQTKSLAKRVTSTCIGCTTFWFLSTYLAECLGHFEFKTLFTSSSSFCEGQKFSAPGHPTGCTCGVGTIESFFWDQEFLCSASFFQATIQAAGFLQVPPKSLFKRLVLSTGLWQHTKMSTILKSPNGLKNLECKKGQLRNWPPVPYVPETDLVTTKEEPQVLKVKLPDDTCDNMPIYSRGNTVRNTLHTLLQSSASSSRRGWMQGAGSLERLL